MTHILLHFVLPCLIAFGFYRKHWLMATLVLWATMLVDLDHLLADPIYDPTRCSIDFHPLHTTPAILVYLALFLVPLLFRRQQKPTRTVGQFPWVSLIGLGLLIHMMLDAADCLSM